MGIKGVFLALCLLVALVAEGQGSPVYNIVDHGAAGDGETDDCNAILDAWNAACRDGGSPTLLIPSGLTFFSTQLNFQGPCLSPLHVQVDGEIVAPFEVWKASEMGHWIMFISIDGLTIDGTGRINGQGSTWWACKESGQCGSSAPIGLAVYKCNDFRLNGLKFIDSPGMHVAIYSCNWVHLSGLTITAPGDSPNTDGIHIEDSQHVEVLNSIIGTGDDCISIGTSTYDLNISQITCGPGHGISVGSLGMNGAEARVEQIHVSYCNFYNTMSGVRIKTWQGGSGFANDITFEHINFTLVGTPIVIDQYYCNGDHNCPMSSSAVQVSNVQYIGVGGSTTSDVAISLNCSESVACTGIVMDGVEIRVAVPGKAGSAFCINAQGQNVGEVIPPVPCLA